MFPTELIAAVTYLNTLAIQIAEGHEDGRVNSIADEDTIIDLLIEKYGDAIEKPVAREWWDVKIYGYPVNIKSSAFKSAADNFSSKAAILYALTDLPENKVKVQRWQTFENLLRTHNKDNNRDYYIIALNKTTGECHLQSLKSLEKLTSNGNNTLQLHTLHNTICNCCTQRLHPQVLKMTITVDQHSREKSSTCISSGLSYYIFDLFSVNV